MDKLDMQSPDFTEQNIEKLAALFPNCVTEAKNKNGELQKSIDFDLLKQELSNNIVDGPRERYQLNWPGKREALLTASTPITKTLRPCREESVDFDTTENLFIEGDNLDALKLLQETYLGKVKMIYIDPPYNTGKDFVYSDNFTADKDEYDLASEQKDEDGGRLVANMESNGRFHSDWLDMMYPRLKLARNLLKDDGVIFISIDDNEVDNLRKICDEVFGTDNSIFNYTIKVRYEGKTLVEDMLFQKVVENIVVYSKCKEKLNLIRQSEEYSYDKFIWDIEETGQPEIMSLGGKDVEVFTLDKYNIIKKEPSDELLKEIWATGSILDGNSSGRFFRDHLSGRYETDGLGVLYKIYGIGGDNLPYRYFTGPKREGATKGKYYQGVPLDIVNNPNEAKKKKPIVTFYDLAADFGNCRHEGGVAFRSGKKPLVLFKNLFKIIPWGSNDIIMDFFAGSATTAHAVMQQNAEDRGNRKFIMVQLPEVTDEKSEAFKAGYSTIAEISKERIRRAGKKIKEDNADKEGIDDLDTGFRVLKVDSSNMKDVYYAPDAITQGDLVDQTDNIKDDRTAEDLLFQVLLDWGVDLSLPINKESIEDKTVFFVDGSYDTPALAACFDSDITEDLVKQLAKREPLRAVFRDAGYGSDSTKINIKQIFKLVSPQTEVKAI